MAPPKASAALLLGLLAALPALSLLVTLATLPGAGAAQRVMGSPCHPFMHTALEKQGGYLERGYGTPAAARLGNHLFMYASAVGIASANNMELRHRPWPVGKPHSIFEIFEIPEDYATAGGAPGLTKLGERAGAALALEAACLSLRGGKYDLYGFRQSFKYFNEPSAEAAVRATLRFRNASLVRYAKGFLAAVNATATADDALSLQRRGGGARQVVGVHIRSSMGLLGAFAGCLPEPEFYLRAMTYFRRRFSNVVFVYAAEAGGQEWFRSEVLAKLDPLKGFDCFPVQSRDPIETLAVLTLCDASVFSYGSYGWFGAWLAGGPVAYSRHLTGEATGGASGSAVFAERHRGVASCDTVQRSGVGVRDHIPPAWIPV